MITVYIQIILLFAICRVEAQLAWPRQSNLIGFWPLDNYFKLRDISGNNLNGSGLSGSYVATEFGPFGDPSTSYRSNPSNITHAGIMQLTGSTAAQRLSLANLQAFTISFFVKSSSGSDQYLQFLNSDGSTNSNPVSFYQSSMEYGLCGAGSCTTFSKAHNYNIWNYVALTFQRENCLASVYGRFGRITNGVNKSSICTAMASSTGGLRVGSGYPYSNWQTGVQMACLMIYNTSLSEDEIMQNYESCRSALNGAQCGTPRLPIPQLPSVPVTPARAGEFPWVAGIRLISESKHVCSSTIISPYWLLTAASCFETSSSPTLYGVHVGMYDTAASESFRRSHNVKSIVFHRKPYTNFYDIALVELSTAIDFSNVYVNEACIPRDDSSFLLNAYSFVIGWGENGRNELTSKTTIRYAQGTIASNNSCALSWNEPTKVKTEPLLCFRGQSDPTVPCSGDQGSPLALTDYSKLVQVGIFSRRNANCSILNSQTPLFTRVAEFWPWIKSQIACVNPSLHYPQQCPY